jgi:hypothetical protein
MDDVGNSDTCTVRTAAAGDTSLGISSVMNCAPTGTQCFIWVLVSELILAGSGFSSSRSSSSELSGPEYWSWDSIQKDYYHIDRAE